MVGIIFLGRFCYLGPNGNLNSYSVFATFCPAFPILCPHMCMHTGHVHGPVLLKSPLIFADQDLIIGYVGLLYGREHSGPIELERALDLNCYLVPSALRTQSEKDSVLPTLPFWQFPVPG